MTGAVGKQEVEDHEQRDFGEIRRMINDGDDQEEYHLDPVRCFVDDADGELDGEEARIPSACHEGIWGNVLTRKARPQRAKRPTT